VHVNIFIQEDFLLVIGFAIAISVMGIGLKRKDAVIGRVLKFVNKRGWDMIFKFIFKAIIAVAALSFVNVANAQEVKFATDNSNIPFSYMENGKLVGFDI